MSKEKNRDQIGFFHLTDGSHCNIDIYKYFHFAQFEWEAILSASFDFA